MYSSNIPSNPISIDELIIIMFLFIFLNAFILKVKCIISAGSVASCEWFDRALPSTVFEWPTSSLRMGCCDCSLHWKGFMGKCVDVWILFYEFYTNCDNINRRGDVLLFPRTTLLDFLSLAAYRCTSLTSISTWCVISFLLTNRVNWLVTFHLSDWQGHTENIICFNFCPVKSYL